MIDPANHGEAERLMKARLYPEAVIAFEARLDENPRDLTALLRLGVCHLLNRSEASFVAIYRQAERLISELGGVPAQVVRLWAEYRRLFMAVTATALVLAASVASPGCSSRHKYSGGVYEDPSTVNVETDGATASDLADDDADAGVDATSAPR